MGVGTNLANSITGNVSKAALLIYKPPASYYADMEKVRQVEMKLIGDKQNMKFKAQKEALKTKTDIALSARVAVGAKSVQNLYDAVTKGDSIRAAMAKETILGPYMYYEFQYNPETITMRGQQGSFMSRQGAPSSGLNELAMTNINAETKLSFKVIFDQVNNKDAFMANKLNMTSIADIASTVTMFCNTYSVQGDVDGLLALCTQPATRRVIFCFGKMFFTGEIEQVSATYTMFSPTGRPIAAEVNFSITQSRNAFMSIENSSQTAYDDGYWDRAVKDFFGKPGEDVKVDLRPGGFGNLVNLNG